MMIYLQFIEVIHIRIRSVTINALFLLAILSFIAPFSFSSEQQKNGLDRELSPIEHSPPVDNFAALSPAEQKKKMQEIAMLDRFLKLPPDKLRRIRQTIEKIENMSFEEKEILRNQLQAYKSLHPRQQEDLRKRFDRLPSEERAIMRQRWLQMTAEERIAERIKIQQLSPEERRQFHKNIIHNARKNQLSHPPMNEGMNDTRDHQDTPRSNREGGPFVPPE